MRRLEFCIPGLGSSRATSSIPTCIPSERRFGVAGLTIARVGHEYIYISSGGGSVRSKEQYASSNYSCSYNREDLYNQ